MSVEVEKRGEEEGGEIGQDEGDLKGSSVGTNYFDKRKDRSRGGSFSHQVGTTLILCCIALFESS